MNQPKMKEGVPGGVINPDFFHQPDYLKSPEMTYFSLIRAYLHGADQEDIPMSFEQKLLIANHTEENKR